MYTELPNDFGKIERERAVGGHGSGSTYRWSSKQTADACRALDVTTWHRQNLLRPDLSFTTSWSRNGSVVASIGVWMLPGAVELRYSVGRGDGPREEVREQIRLTWTACHYGGRRPWFICSGVVSGRVCGRRVGKLYEGGRYFLCRHCYDLTYESRRESPRDRALSKAQAIRHRLGGSMSMIHPFPHKPKGMHWRTYQRLREEHDAAYEESWRHVARWLEKMDASIERKRPART